MVNVNVVIVTGGNKVDSTEFEFDNLTYRRNVKLMFRSRVTGLGQLRKKRHHMTYLGCSWPHRWAAAWPERLILMTYLVDGCLGGSEWMGGPGWVTGKTRAPDGDVIFAWIGDIFRKQP